MGDGQRVRVLRSLCPVVRGLATFVSAEGFFSSLSGWAGYRTMVPELPELPEGMGLPALDPKARGGWQGPDDVVVSVTPLWPRPNRSWRWLVTWLVMVVSSVKFAFVRVLRLRRSVFVLK